MKTYRGYRIPEGRKECGVCTVTVESNGRIEPLPLCLNVRRHSPTGFCWGYCGSGPAQLALAILCDLIGEDAAKLRYQKFKAGVISGMPRDGWILPEETIRSWLEITEKKGK